MEQAYLPLAPYLPSGLTMLPYLHCCSRPPAPAVESNLGLAAACPVARIRREVFRHIELMLHSGGIELVKMGTADSHLADTDYSWPLHRMGDVREGDDLAGDLASAGKVSGHRRLDNIIESLGCIAVMLSVSCLCN